MSSACTPGGRFKRGHLFEIFLKNHSRQKSRFVALTPPRVHCFTAMLSSVKNPPHPPQNI